jgi:hypothetical protein
MGKLYVALRAADVPEQLALDAVEEVAEHYRVRFEPPLFPLHVVVTVVMVAAACFGGGMAFAWILGAHHG